MAIRKEIVIILIITFCIFAVVAGMFIYEWIREPTAPLAPRADALVMPTTESSNARPSTIPWRVSGRDCESTQCAYLAKQMHNWRDRSVDPCTDFYQYACGKYIEHTDIDGDRNTKKQIEMQSLLHGFLVKNATSDSKSENTMRHVYQKCEGLKRTKVGNFSQEIRDVYKDILSIGSWPMTDNNWLDSTFNFKDRLSNLSKLSVLNFGLFEYVPSDTKSRHLYMNRPEQIFQTNRKRIEKMVQEICKVEKLTCDNQKIKNDFDNVWQFKKIVEGISTPATNNDYNVLFWKQVKSNFKIFDFSKILEPLMSSQDADHVTQKIVISSKFSADLQEIENCVQKTEPRTLANFLTLKYLDTVSWFTTINEKDAKRDCTAVVNHLLPNAALRVFVRNHYDKRNMEEVGRTVKEMQTSYIEMFNSSKYLTQQSKTTMISKIQKMKIQIGYPEEFEAHGALDKTFEELKIEESDTYFSIVRKVHVLISKWNMEFVAGSYPMNPTEALNVANAHYMPGTNQLAILVAFMNIPNFHWTYPTYAKLANVGTVIGHEMGHAFDNIGIQLDDSSRQRAWMDSGDYKSYLKNVDCLEKQYDEYDDPVYGKNLIGKNVIGEIIADHLGLEVAFTTYQKLWKNHEPIPGVKDRFFDQLFFNFHALDYCTTPPTQSLQDVQQETHPTNTYRVNGMVKNLKQFAVAFDCPVGSPMNPKEKCELF